MNVDTKDPGPATQGDLAAAQVDTLISALILTGCNPDDVLTGAFGAIIGRLLLHWGHAEAASACAHAGQRILARLPQPTAPDLASLSPQGRA